MNLKVLFIGGTGIISSACSALAVEKGIDLFLLNRGNTTSRPAPAGATILHGDIRDLTSARKAIVDPRIDRLIDTLIGAQQRAFPARDAE